MSDEPREPESSATPTIRGRPERFVLYCANMAYAIRWMA